VTDRAIFQVGHLERVPLGTPYPGVVAHVGRLLGKLPGRAELVIDFTGVGRPVFDMFTYSGIYPQGVLITGGTAETRDGAICSVPKLTLVSRVQALLHEGRLKILRELSEADTLVRELKEEWAVSPERVRGEALLRLPHKLVMFVGQAWLPEGAEQDVNPDHEHDAFAWWPRDIDEWPAEAGETLPRMARWLSE